MTLSWEDLERIRDRREWRIPVPPTCPHCEYNLTGLPSSRCPECGRIFNWRAVQRRAGRIWSAVNALRHADRDARTGLKIAGLGWALVLPLLLLGAGGASCFLRLLGLGAGLIAFILGAQVLRVRRVPGWARCYIEGPPPSLGQGLASMLLGIGLIVAALLVWLPPR